MKLIRAAFLSAFIFCSLLPVAAQPPANTRRRVNPYYQPSSREATIRDLQARVEDFRDNGARKGASAGHKHGRNDEIGCTDSDFKKRTGDLKSALQARADALERALQTALAAPADARQTTDYQADVREIRAAIDITQSEIRRIPTGICPLALNPLNLVTIYEETDRDRILQYSPRNDGVRVPTLSVDRSSKIRIDINSDVLTTDAVLGQLKMNATLTGTDGKTTKVEVLNYAQIDIDPKSQRSQQGVNTQAARDLKGTIEDLYYTSKDLVANFYGEDPLQPDAKWWAARKTPGAAEAILQGDAAAARIDALYRSYKSEIAGIINSLTANPVLVRMVAEPVFGMSSSTMKTLATDFSKNLDIMLGGGNQAAAARAWVVSATLTVFDDLMYTQDFINARELIEPDLPDSLAADEQFDAMYLEEVEEMKRRILPGQIDLPSYQAPDGGQLVLQIQMQTATEPGDPGASVGSPLTSSATFTIHVKDYRTRAEVVDSAFYVRRLHDVLDANGKLTRVNFPSAAGVTLDVTFRNRGPFAGLLHRCMDETGVLHLPGSTACGAESNLLVTNPTKKNRFFTALAPGIGVNVSLLNFPNPGRRHLDANGNPALNSQNQPYDVDAPASVQVGAGFVGSVFGGMVQFTFGWDLNVQAPRAYWGVGFSFTKVAQAAVSAAKKL